MLDKAVKRILEKFTKPGDVEEGASRNVLVESARIARGNIEDTAAVTADDFDALILPGGFSYGDYLRSGAMARFSPIMAAVEPLPLVPAMCTAWNAFCGSPMRASLSTAG